MKGAGVKGKHELEGVVSAWEELDLALTVMAFVLVELHC